MLFYFTSSTLMLIVMGVAYFPCLFFFLFMGVAYFFFFMGVAYFFLFS